MSQITIDFSLNGIVEGAKGAAKVIGYHVLTDALIVAGAYLSQVSVTTHSAEQAAIVAASIAVGNSLLKFLKDWLGTKSETVEASPLVA